MTRTVTTTRLTATLLAATACLLMSGCPSQTVKDGAKAAAAPTPGDTSLNATTSQCEAERDMMQTAVDAYEILNSAKPTSEAAMVPDWLRAESPYMDLDAAGNVVAAPGSGCT